MILYMSLFLYFDAWYVFIVLCLSIAQHVVDSVPWCTDTPGDYYEEQAGEKIPEDLQPAEEARDWHVDVVE